MAGDDTRSNRGYKQFEALVTPKQLRKKYLFGIEIKDKDGNDLPDSALQCYINNAVSWLEHELDLAIMPRNIEENRDYHANDYFQWGYLQLNNYPVLKINSLKVAYLRDTLPGVTNPTSEDVEDESVLDIPVEWIRLSKQEGIVRLVPNNQFPARLQVEQGGSFFPELFRRMGHVPDLWVIDYDYGFEGGKIPVMVNYAIALHAAMQALTIAGALVLGAGIAGTSISMDGLSSSIQTTQSAENSAYSAQRKEHEDMLFGKTKDDPGILGQLKNYYKGSNLQII